MCTREDSAFTVHGQVGFLTYIHIERKNFPLWNSVSVAGLP